MNEASSQVTEGASGDANDVVPTMLSSPSKPGFVNSLREAVQSHSTEVEGDQNIPATVADTVPTAMEPVPKVSSTRPMRLLRVSTFAELYPIPPYELIPEACFISCTYEDFVSTQHAKTGVISWRWGAAKPGTLEDARGEAGAKVVPKALVTFVLAQTAAMPDIEYLWLDWACVPQYQGGAATMEEINRSGSYYRLAKHMIIWCFNTLEEGTSLVWEYSEYFGRAWTLSERLHRGLGADPLSVSDFLPMRLRGTSEGFIFQLGSNAITGAQNGEMHETKWMAVLQEIMAAVNALSQDSFPAVDEVMAVLDLVISRYPRLVAVMATIRDHLSLLLNSASIELLYASVRLYALAMWMVDTDSGLLVLRPDEQNRLAVFILCIWTSKQRMIIDNINSNTGGDKVYSNCTSLLMDLNMMAADARNHTARSAEGFDTAPLVENMMSTAASLWTQTTSRKVVESVDEAWLCRYLVYWVGAVYHAYEPRDLFFAIQKLFGLQAVDDYSQAAVVWGNLAHLAGIETGHPYAWMRNLSRPGYTIELSACHLPVTKTNSNHVNALSSNSFGIMSFDAGDQPAETAERSFADVMLCKDLCSTWTAESYRDTSIPWLLRDDPGLLMYMCGFHVTADSIGKLKKLDGVWERIPIKQRNSPDEPEDPMDKQLSLRGRSALQSFEYSFRKALLQMVADGCKCTDGNALFISIKYSSLLGHARAVLLWCFVHPSRQAWCVEEIASVPAMSMKGSPYGICVLLQLLCQALCQLLPADEVACSSHLPSFDTGCGRITVEAMATGQEADWWQRPLCLESGVACNAMPVEPEVNLTEVLGIIAAHSGMKTQFTDADLQYVDASFNLVAAQGMTSETVTNYLTMLRNNYVYDRTMAQHIGYYAAYCNKLAAHLTAFPDIGTVHQMISQTLSDLLQDMVDAIEYAEERLGDDHADVLLAREGKRLLREACAQAGVDV